MRISSTSIKQGRERYLDIYIKTRIYGFDVTGFRYSMFEDIRESHNFL